MLDGGFPGLQGRVLKKGEIVWRGCRSINAIPFGAGAGPMARAIDGIMSIADLVTDGATTRTIFNEAAYSVVDNMGYILLKLFPDKEISYIIPGMSKYQSDWDKLDQLKDMVPNSDFIKNYVSETVKITYKKKNADLLVAELRKKMVLFVPVYYVVLVAKPTYEYLETYRDAPKFDNDLPIGYIVGTNSNMLSMTGNMEDPIRAATVVAGSAFGLAHIVHLAESFSLIGLINNSPQYAADAAKARDLFWDIDGTMNSLIGSAESDGFVAKESQYYPAEYSDNRSEGFKVDVHTKIMKNGKGDITELHYNHNKFEYSSASEETWRAIRGLIAHRELMP
jgi:hypothetical protein